MQAIPSETQKAAPDIAPRAAMAASASEGLRRDLIGSFAAIERLWRELLDQRDHRPDNLIELVEKNLDTTRCAITTVKERFSEESLQHNTLSLRMVAHDFVNQTQTIVYGCRALRKIDDEAFQAWRGHLDEIQAYYKDVQDRLWFWVTSCVSESEPSALLAEAETDAGPTNQPAAKSVTPVLGRMLAVDDKAPHILIVEDDQAARDQLAELLPKPAFRVTLADDGRDALEKMERYCYDEPGSAIDLVLLDLHMRDIDGFQVLKEMKRDYGLRSIPVVMVSASGDIDSVAECIARGADDYLTKPPEPRLLHARVASCLAKCHLRRQERALHERLQLAKQRTDDLLYTIFPYTVAEELITSGTVKPRGCENVAILFCDIVEFTPYCKERPAAEVVAKLHELFSAYETAVEAVGVEKIKTIGDCMMIAAGLTRRFDNPVLSCLKCGEKMIEAAKACSAGWQVRIGIHIGPVVAGMAGNRQYSFDVWGDTVNTAQRVESNAMPNTICVSEPAWAKVYPYCCGSSLGLKQLKGGKNMEVFHFERFRVRAVQSGKDSRRSPDH